jgi:Ser/Thr protein kinase RdoA (MazF antagonist)
VPALPDLSPAELARAIEAQYDLRVTSAPTSLPPGVHSRAWLLATTRGSWVAKLSNPASDPLPKLERQIQLWLYLHQHAIRAPQILPLRSGSFIGSLAAGQLHYPIQLMKHETLSRIETEHASGAILVSIGELIARLHQVLDHYPERNAYAADRQKAANEWGAQDQGFWPLLPGLPDRSALLPAEQEWLRSIDARAEGYIQQRYPDPAAVSMALLHGDLNFEHIQFLADGTPYLFDFGDMSWGPIAHELAVLFLNTFCDSQMSFSQWEALKQQILLGYRAKRDVSDLDLAMIPLFIVNRVVARARYAVELATEAQLAIDWQSMKRTYQLAEYLLNQAKEDRMSDRDEPRMGAFFPLADFERRILADPDVLGMIYHGSLGRGDGDRCSDLDISLWLRDEALAKPGRIEHYVSWLGEPQFVCLSPIDTGMASNCFVGPNWQRVELDVQRRHDVTPHPYFHGATIVKDTDGQLASLVAASGPPTAEPTREAARKVIEEAIYHIGFVTMQNVRGSHHHAMSNLCELANNVYTLLAQVRGREGWAERFIERFLSDDELALLYAAWPAGPEREAIRHAARGLWEWTRYVWAQAEQTLGEQLGISLDTAAFLEAIERPYNWDATAPHEG